MGLLQFIGIVFVVVLIVGCAAWALKAIAPSSPTVPLACNVLYGLGGLIIILLLLSALGLGHDVMIPQLFGSRKHVG